MEGREEVDIGMKEGDGGRCGGKEILEAEGGREWEGLEWWEWRLAKGGKDVEKRDAGLREEGGGICLDKVILKEGKQREGEKGVK